MTKLLRNLLRPDYLQTIKAAMMEQHHNNTSLARETNYSKPHIGNVMKGNGSDDALAAICKVLRIEIRSIMKDPHGADSNQADLDGDRGEDRTEL
jgi:hypothetical protein